ncbi:MAG: SDR family oxidoreductase [Catalinimonas sp.]
MSRQTKPQWEKQNPVDQYPKPPFPRQPQERPGGINQMDPLPDHGEESYKGSGRLKGRKALVTGGDSGVGRAAVIAFAREGADVAFNYLPSEEENAQEVVKLIEAEGRIAVPLPGDLADEAFCKKLIEDAAKGLGGIDILVNNAGRQTAQESILDITTDQFDNTFKVNVYALFWLCKAAMSYLGPGASVINVTSVVAYNPIEVLLDYSSTKAAIAAFTKAFAQQVAQKGIRVNGVAPGPFWTPLQTSGGQPQEMIEKFGAMTPLGRPGQPAEVGPLFVLLASQESSYITGEVMGISGGMMPN